MVMSKYYEKYWNVRLRVHTSKTVPIEEWVAIGCNQPYNKIFVFKEKNNKLLQTGETIQYGSIVKVDNIKIFHHYFYKGKMIYKKEYFALLSWGSNQHMDFNKNHRYVRAHNILSNIKEHYILLNSIKKYGFHHPKLFGINQLPTSKSDIKMFYNNSTLLVPIYATKIQKKVRKYILLNAIKKTLRKYLNNDCVYNIITILFKYL